MSDSTVNDSAIESIAVVGMAGRLPGASDIDAFWRMIVEGREGITHFSPDELDPSIDPALRANPNYVPAKGLVADAECFDAKFFGISPMEARIMDPQQRLSLEVCWHALEDAAIDAARFDGLIGVYAGSNANRYRKTNLAGTETEARYGDFNTALVNEPEFLATRIAYKLDLRGPAITVTTACSTSLVAIAEACKALFAFDCDVALAGGASITTPLKAGYLYQEGSMLSADGHCRPFDAKATGTTFNDGVAYVVLKRTEDAIADGDRIYAVVRGFGVNNDGANKVSFTAPSIDGQAAAVSGALDYANIDPATVGLLETHGTATPMGDPIEVAALKRVFADVSERRQCAIGSVKSNIGHVVHTAGVAGFIKAVLSVRDAVLPPSLFFEDENPRLNLADSPFYVNTELKDWPTQAYPRRAGISSFGVGGTNAHVVIEQAPDVAATSNCADYAKPRILCLSAKSAPALKRSAAQLSGYLESAVSPCPDTISRVLHSGRAPMLHRTAWIADDRSSLDVGAIDARYVVSGCANPGRQIGFMCTGQGSQRPAMGATIAKHDPTFAKHWFAGIDHLRTSGNIDLQAILEPSSDDDEIAPAIQRTEFAQPALYLFEYAMGCALMQHGIRPDFLIGHSIGEFAAAALAGVFTFEQGLDIVARRGALMQAQPEGDMLAVFIGADDARQYVSDAIAVAAENAPGSTVLSGPADEVRELAETLQSRDIDFRSVKTSHAFHSSMMEPAASEFREYLSNLDFSAPNIPIISTVTGKTMSDAEAVSADYWANQLLQPVRFAAAISFAQDQQSVAVIEIGPGKVLTSLAQMSAVDDRLVAHASAPDAGTHDQEQHAALRAVAFAWTQGVIDTLPTPQAGPTAPTLSLPGYPFEKTRHWVDATTDLSPTAAPIEAPVVAPPTTVMDKVMTATNHREQLIDRVTRVLEDVSGFELSDCAPTDEFLDIGFDSILLTQAALSVQQAFDVQVTFRQLMEDYTSVEALVEFLEPQVPAPSVAPEPAPGAPVTLPMPTMPVATGEAPMAPTSELQALIHRQLEVMQTQLAMLSGVPQQPAAVPAVTSTTAPAHEHAEAPKPEGATAKQGPRTRIQRTRTEHQTLTAAQQQFIERTIDQYVKSTATSKDFVQSHRHALADPRTVSGFNPEWKEMVYPIVTDRSSGSKITDIDGREYVDLTNGFGPILFGHSPDFIQQAVIDQVRAGTETGPQSPLAGEVAKLCIELTGNERVAFASTGSEAVCGALRLARTVTGRSKVVIFEGSYHGIFDEVVVRPGSKGSGLPAAPGIPREMTENMIVLPWADDASLERIRELGTQLAAVMVEPVQSRNPGVQPGEFLKSIREITEENQRGLIFDEIVTGFRIAPGGAQEHFGIRADLATYGKVIGGGYPIGVIAGKSRFMDALDGGAWQFGDDSTPQVGVTFFAGTFVRHPVALAATRAVLLKLRESGPELQQTLASTTRTLVDELNAFLKAIDCPISIQSFASYFNISVPEDQPQAGLLFYLMRLYGIHIWQYRPCFLTTAHSAEDLQRVVDAFRRAVSELVRHGLLKGDAVALERMTKKQTDTPPVAGARLGKDESGVPAWFVADPDNPGKYKIVGYKSTG
ncbi:MAG: aminotransferase class III-fold pyridoxal phosphate-dependent enzyme [Pseudomonadota bacterium]